MDRHLMVYSQGNVNFCAGNHQFEIEMERKREDDQAWLPDHRAVASDAKIPSQAEDLVRLTSVLKRKQDQEPGREKKKKKKRKIFRASKAEIQRQER
jgi:hypothetical protein